MINALIAPFVVIFAIGLGSFFARSLRAPVGASEGSLARQRRLRLFGILILAIGLLAGALIYHASPPGNAASSASAPSSRFADHDAILIGGKATVYATEVRVWFASLWHGRMLALMVVAISASLCLVCFFLAHPLLVSPTKGDIAPRVSLREVHTSDLPILFEHQLDPEATRMAAFPSRDHDAFMAHWEKIMSAPTGVLRTILLDERVAGYIGSWTDGPDRLLGYWIGREFWGRGIASAALSRFLRCETIRPLTAHVATHNAASIRVLQKAGFMRVSKGSSGFGGDEVVFKL